MLPEDATKVNDSSLSQRISEEGSSSTRALFAEGGSTPSPALSGSIASSSGDTFCGEGSPLAALSGGGAPNKEEEGLEDLLLRL